MKSQTIFECSKCGAQNSKWAGRCNECGGWSTMKEVTNYDSVAANKNNKLSARPAEVIDFANIHAADIARTSSNIGEVDRVLGGGIVPGSLILLSGEPGIGKSTLLLQLAASLSTSILRQGYERQASNLSLSKERNGSYSPTQMRGGKGGSDNIPDNKSTPQASIVLYNSGEESAEQIKMRFDRLELKTNNVKYLGETDIDVICATIAAKKPALAIVDSIQTITTQEVDAPFGSVAQIKAATAKLMETAKQNHIPIIVVGHITKDGDIAGPKTLEHMVDAVLYFEGERLSNYRILRAVKNRFGNTNEIGIFEMDSVGLKEVPNPSAEFLAQKSDVSGSVLTCILGGNRPLLVEIQALTSPTSFGYPLRKASGFDLNRLNIIAAIINQRTNIKCANHDIILNVAGGIKIQDPAADLAVALAIISSIKNIKLPKNMAAVGELGLGGEIRAVSQLPKRNEEASRLGITKIISPSTHKTLEKVIGEM
ncbi:MAG: AAA family ATPase [Patescibacteria group bacterium]|jgi:DNA repair protein RadA/Sms